MDCSKMAATSANKTVNSIRYQLVEISEKEAMKLYRMARRLQEHGGSCEVVSEIREEAHKLHNNSYPYELLHPFVVWKYAFRCG